MNKTVILAAVAVALFAANADTLDLAGEWRPSDAAGEHALAATVPGGVHDALIASDRPRIDYVYTAQMFNDDLTHCTLDVFADLSDGTTVTNRLEIDNPPLWWPNGAGERAFYTFTVDVNGEQVDGDRVTLTTDRPAFFVWVDSPGCAFSDNCLTLLPGRPVTVFRQNPQEFLQSCKSCQSCQDKITVLSLADLLPRD